LNPPPAFAWDECYAAVGGRSIRLSEVTDLLQEIYNHQYPRFDGEVASVRQTFTSPADTARHVKDKALEFGADIVGICEIEPRDVYRGRVICPTRIVVTCIQGFVVHDLRTLLLCSGLGDLRVRGAPNIVRAAGGRNVGRACGGRTARCDAGRVRHCPFSFHVDHVDGHQR
jgi:hypothetical protein